MPMKTTKQLALGRVTSGYRYEAEHPAALRHIVDVEWKRTDLPRSAVKQDLLYTLGSVLTIFAPSKNNAVERLEHLLQNGTDPGAVTAMPKAAGFNGGESDDDSAVDSPEFSADFEQAATDQILTRIGEDFAGHDLATLVTAILEAEGYKCVQAPPGPDGGIDITAGRGPLGLDSPTVLVQVKSGSQVGSPVVSQLQGVMATHGADQGLLVAWGGLTKQARDSIRHQSLRVRIWEAGDVVEAVLRNYDRISADVQALLPLKRVWMLSDVGA
nr:restriction endonuclease [Rhodococcus oryzae]